MYEKIAFKNLVSSKKSWKSGVAEDSSRSDLFNKIFLPRHKMLLGDPENFKIVRKFPRKWTKVEQWRKFRVDVVYFVRREYD